MGLKLKVEDNTVKALFVLLGGLSFLLGLSNLGFIGFFNLQTSQFYGIFLLLGAVVLITETYHGRINWVKNDSVITGIIVFLSVLLGLWELTNHALNPTMKGIQGLTLLIMGVLLIKKLFN